MIITRINFLYISKNFEKINNTKKINFIIYFFKKMSILKKIDY